MGCMLHLSLRAARDVVVVGLPGSALACPSPLRAAAGDNVLVHLERLDDCYVSASITGSTYSGGAHPYEDFSTFNWNVRAKRTLRNTDLFRSDSNWKSEITVLYRQRLQASRADLSEWTLSSDGVDALFTNGFIITAGGLRFVQHEGAARNENVPAVELSWNDLAPWLVPEASCSMPLRR